jgi:hypothetical protein
MICFKGDPTAEASEEAQSTFDTQLMGMMQQQYAKQSAITTYLTNQMTPQISAGGIGIAPNALAAARTQATDTLSTQYQGAMKSAASSEDQSGLPSGVNAQIQSSLGSQEAQAQAGGQQQITLANEQQRQQNYWNSINVLNGQAATENPLGYANAATAGSGAVAGLSQAVTASNQSQLLGALGGVASGVGSIIGGKLAGCWIAKAHWNGWLDPRVISVRHFLFTVWAKHWYAKPVLKAYTKWGRWISEQRVLVTMLSPLFDLALKSARESGC